MFFSLMKINYGNEFGNHLTDEGCCFYFGSYLHVMLAMRINDIHNCYFNHKLQF